MSLFRRRRPPAEPAPPPPGAVPGPDHRRNRPKFNFFRNLFAIIGVGCTLYFLITQVLMRVLAWITQMSGGGA